MTPPRCWRIPASVRFRLEFDKGEDMKLSKLEQESIILYNEEESYRQHLPRPQVEAQAQAPCGEIPGQGVPG